MRDVILAIMSTSGDDAARALCSRKPCVAAESLPGRMMQQWSPSGCPGTNGQGAELSRKWEENGYWAPGDQYMCHGLGEILENSIISSSGQF